MAYVLSTAFAYFVEVVCATMLFSNIYNTKKKLPHIILFGIFVFSISMLLFFFVDNIYINIFTFFLANFIYAMTMFESSWLSALILSVILEAGMMGAEFLTLNILTVIFDIELSGYKSSDFLYFLTTVINKAIYFFMCQIISQLKFLYRDKSGIRITKNKMPLFLLLYPFCTILACVLFWLMSYEYDFSREINIFMMVVCVLFLISILATYFLYNQTAKKEAEVYRLQSELERKNIDEAYYKVLDYQNEELKTLVHDEKNHLSVIKSLSDSDEIEKYIDKIYVDLDKYSSSGKTKNKMLI